MPMISTNAPAPAPAAPSAAPKPTIASIPTIIAATMPTSAPCIAPFV